MRAPPVGWSSPRAPGGTLFGLWQAGAHLGAGADIAPHWLTYFTDPQGGVFAVIAADPQP